MIKAKDITYITVVPHNIPNIVLKVFLNPSITLDTLLSTPSASDAISNIVAIITTSPTRIIGDATTKHSTTIPITPPEFYQLFLLHQICIQHCLIQIYPQLG